ncbi:MAG: response regulator [Deltaproteobacteria bacterium]|nr:response regulator [Deltaproteobacteria bacterium]MCW5801412.1 response regulator [Deltaproteobacteria bacterium]
MGSAPAIRNVLIVDDDVRILDSWKRSAERERTVHSATDSVTAKRLAQLHPLDMALVDLRLGTSSGIELVRELRRTSPNLMIALCSGYVSVEATVAAVRAGADVIVFKPITFREILARLQENLDEPDLDETPTLAKAEWEHIMRVLSDCHGNITAAAKKLGIFRSSLQRRLRKYAPHD